MQKQRRPSLTLPPTRDGLLLAARNTILKSNNASFDQKGTNKKHRQPAKILQVIKGPPVKDSKKILPSLSQTPPHIFNGRTLFSPGFRSRWNGANHDWREIKNTE